MKNFDPNKNTIMSGLPKAPTYMKQIAELLPYHRTYVELYDHGPMLLPAKKRSSVEVFNDPNDTVRNVMANLRSNITTELAHAVRSGSHPICRFHNVQIESKSLLDMLEVYDSNETLFVAAGELCDDFMLLSVMTKIEGKVMLFGPLPLAEDIKLLKWKHRVLTMPSEPNGIVDVWIKC